MPIILQNIGRNHWNKMLWPRPTLLWSSSSYTHIDGISKIKRISYQIQLMCANSQFHLDKTMLIRGLYGRRNWNNSSIGRGALSILGGFSSLLGR